MAQIALGNKIPRTEGKLIFVFLKFIKLALIGTRDGIPGTVCRKLEFRIQIFCQD